MDQDVIWALEIMGKGMFSIFLVIFILYLIVILLTKVTNLPRFKKNEDEE
jgi:Oxaloacetate decarboxylase, gamma chain.